MRVQDLIPADAELFTGVFLVTIAIAESSEILPETIGEIWYTDGLAADPRWAVLVYRDEIPDEVGWESSVFENITVEICCNKEVNWYDEEEELAVF